MALNTESNSLAERLLRGDRIALARAISLVENGASGAEELLHHVYPRTGRAFRVGVTGPPGAGKSTLVGRLVAMERERGRSVGVIAVDPSSPFTRGALLGDRIRFQDLPADPGIFVRSMASRGSPGGIAYRTGEACDLLDAYGMDVILVETVGVGQSELDIAAAVHTTLVVLVPESGDEVQAMKAGLMEIGHVFAVNKADREGSGRITRGLQDMLKLRPPGPDGWEPPVIAVSALREEGMDGLLESIEEHREHLASQGALGALKRARAEQRIRELIEEELNARFWMGPGVLSTLKEGMERIDSGESSPYREAKILIRAMNHDEGAGR